ncbi:hydantoinase/carbamoylase family amidase [Mesorhizobium sp. BAC0120]|uniref:hydantoinase/carbamoylase family amidase n=1 Tax=Mesorhizobium sp. BAC0120 TaxID=3090670 RepID=UPI00298C34EE|nr:hydantoinase/carbamoylase family amidase [Mesorhizobium sp. BAC0120]MDW6023204.1 hydantoinase/carbamoylase family amidase [Mesorhizobium sp. BAC0120]
MAAIPTIDSERLWARLMRLAEIGATPDGGVDRQALSDGEALAWRQMITWGEEAGLSASTDPVANLFLTLPGEDPSLPPLVIGSHLDTQPTGGKFDGAFGVVAALEVVSAFAGAGVTGQRDIVVVAWMNEEGSRFAPGMMGSEAFTGKRTVEQVGAVIDADGFSVGAEIDRLHGRFPNVPRRPLGFPVFAYIEPHIEQNVLLEKAGKVIGVVSGIQGKKTFEIEILGDKGHAGTLPMSERRDTVAAFARVAAKLYDAIPSHAGGGKGETGGKKSDPDPDVRFTIGRVEVFPNAPSVVADRVRFRIDLRHPDNEVLEALGDLVGTICSTNAAPCDAKVVQLVSAPSNTFDLKLRDMIAAAAEARGYPSMPLLSFAGHDARQFASVAPSAMIFIPCHEGISHSAKESAEPAHVGAGAQVLCDVIWGLACRGRT